MELSSRCRHVFSEAALHGGDADFVEGRVTLYTCDENVLTASVKDVGHRYTVMVSAVGDTPASGLEVYCSCPHYRLGRYCRHLWASLRAADTEVAQPAPNGEEQLALRFDEDVVAAADEPPIEGSTFSENGDGNSSSTEGTTPAAPAAPPSDLLVGFAPAMRARLGVLFEALPSARERRDRERLCFVVDIDASRRRRQPCFQLWMRREPNGTVDFRQLAALGSELTERLSLEEASLVHVLRGLGPSRATGSPIELPAPLPEDAASVFLERAAASGRLYVQRAPNATPVEATVSDLGTARFELRFRGKDDKFEATGFLRTENAEFPCAALDLALPGGLFCREGHFGALAHREDGAWLHSLWREGSITVPADMGDSLLRALLGQPLPFSFQFLEGCGWEQALAVASPVAVLEEVGGRVHRFQMRVLFQYGDSRVSERTQQRYFVDPNQRIVNFRSPEAERARVEQLETIVRELNELNTSGGTSAGLSIDRQQVPALGEKLGALGWRLEWRGRQLRNRVAKRRFTVSAKQRWLELDGSWEIDGMEVPVPAILEAVREKSPLIRLPDDSLLPLSDEERDRWLALAALAKPVGKKLRIARQHAMWLAAACEGEIVEWDEPAQKWLDAYTELQAPKAEQPGPEFLGSLRPYQQVGLGWLRALDRSQQGGILADAMGLGKTVQCLAWLAERGTKYSEPSLIVVPKSLLPNWERETKRFAPHLGFSIYAGAARWETLTKSLDKTNLLFVTYQTLLRDAEKLATLKYDCIVLDEAQAVKNSGSLTARACRSLNARRRLAMTGTPVENGVGDLLSLLRFTSPDLLAPNFERALREQGAKSLGLLGRAVRPFLLRRTKDSVLPDLPPKTEEKLLVSLEDKERDEYEAMVKYYRAALAGAWTDEGVRKNSARILEALLRLRQISCHPGLLDDTRRDESSAKLEALLTQIEGPLADGKKILVFSQFREFLRIVARHLERMNIGFEMLHGETKDRGAVVDRFQGDPACPILLATLKAGGLGLNLTAAEYVFLLDPWWNPAAESQAIDRAHRIGQTKSVFAYRLVAKDTVEEKILTLQEEKRAVASELVPDGTIESFGGLSLMELRTLLD